MKQCFIILNKIISKTSAYIKNSQIYNLVKLYFASKYIIIT